MNKLLDLIGRHLPFIGILLLTVFGGAAAGLYFDVPGKIQSAAQAQEAKGTAGQYSCPMHPEIASAQPGQCLKCGMALTLASEAPSGHSCCAKPRTTALELPAGHPPIPGHSSGSESATATDKMSAPSCTRHVVAPGPSAQREDHAAPASSGCCPSSGVPPTPVPNQPTNAAAPAQPLTQPKNEIHAH